MASLLDHTEKKFFRFKFGVLWVTPQ